MTPGLRTLDRSRAVRNIGSALGRGLVLVLVVIVLQATRQAQAEDNTRQTVLHGAWLVEGDGLLGGIEQTSPGGGSFELHLEALKFQNAGIPKLARPYWENLIQNGPFPTKVKLDVLPWIVIDEALTVTRKHG